MSKHYIVCQHGLFGNRQDFARFEEHFHEVKPDLNIHVVILSENSNPVRTLDGVNASGMRCMNEILKFLNSLSGSDKAFISFLGHSMGGLILRFALRKIHETTPDIWIQKNIVRKLFFVVASPHVGIPSSSWLLSTSKYVLKHFSRTAADLSMESSELVDLCDEVGISSLNAFERVIMIANSRGDRLVGAASALALPCVEETAVQLDDKNSVVVTEYCPPSVLSDTETALHPNQKLIIERLNSGINNLSRFLVSFPPAYPSLLRHLDNTAHTKIICHGFRDRSRVGLPVIEYIADLLVASGRN
jgi:hypothetical protein